MDLDRAQVEWTLGNFPSQELPELAAQMMMQGFEGPAILELVSYHRPGRWDVPPELVERAFREARRDPLPRAAAARLLAVRMARDIVERSVNPVEGAGRILRVAPWGEQGLEMSPFMAMDELVALWENETDSAERERCERLIVEAAWEFLER